MKTFPLHPVAARIMPVMVIALALTGSPRARAQSTQSSGGGGTASIYEQGDEVGKRVGGFLRRMFYGQDRTSNDVPPTGTPPPAPASGRVAPPPGANYEYAPAPVPTGHPVPRPSSPAPADEQPRPLPVHKTPAHVAEPEKPRHRETPESSHPSSKRSTVQDTPPKHVEEPAPKSATKRKSYTPPTVSGDNPPEARHNSSASSSNRHEDLTEAKPKHKSPASSDAPPEAKHKSSVSPSNSREDLTEAKPKHKTPASDAPPEAKHKSSASPSSSHEDVTEAKTKHKNSLLPAIDTEVASRPRRSEPARQETVVVAPTQDRPSTSEPTKKMAPTAPLPSVAEVPPPPVGTTSPGPKAAEPETKPKQADSPAPSTADNPAEPKFPTGKRSPDHPGRVVSPYPPHNELDVSGLPSGSLAVDPTTSKVFRVP